MKTFARARASVRTNAGARVHAHAWYSMVWYVTVHYSTLQYITVHYSTLQYITVHYMCFRSQAVAMRSRQHSHRHGTLHCVELCCTTLYYGMSYRRRKIFCIDYLAPLCIPISMLRRGCKGYVCGTLNLCRIVSAYRIMLYCIICRI